LKIRSPGLQQVFLYFCHSLGICAGKQAISKNPHGFLMICMLLDFRGQPGKPRRSTKMELQEGTHVGSW
jgi:hypothetical protein